MLRERSWRAPLLEDGSSVACRQTITEVLKCEISQDHDIFRDLRRNGHVAGVENSLDGIARDPNLISIINTRLPWVGAWIKPPDTESSNVRGQSGLGPIFHSYRPEYQVLRPHPRDAAHGLLLSLILCVAVPLSVVVSPSGAASERG